MGFSVAMAGAILAVGALGALAVLSLSALESAHAVLRSEEEAQQGREVALRTLLEITRVHYDSPNSTLEVEVQNKGSSALDLSKLDVLLDGVLETHRIVSRSVQGRSTALLLPEEMALLVLRPVTVAPSSVSVVTESGVPAYWRG